MPILDAGHDFAHPVEGDSAWSESYYFNAYCPVADAGLFTRIGVRPNEGTMDVGLSVWLPNDELAHVVAVREQKEMVDSGLDVGGVRYERIEPLKTWRLTADVDAKAHDLAAATTNARDTHSRWTSPSTRSLPRSVSTGRAASEQRRECGDERERRQGSSRTGRPLDGLDRGRRRSPRARRRARQP